MNELSTKGKKCTCPSYSTLQAEKKHLFALFGNNYIDIFNIMQHAAELIRKVVVDGAMLQEQVINLNIVASQNET